jgi:type IV secretion system protein VirB6
VLFGNLCLHIIEILFDKITANNPDTATLATAVILTIVFFTAFMVLSQVPSIAAGLGGGVSLATKGAISNAVSSIKPSTLQKNHRGIRRDMRILTSPMRSMHKVFSKK